MRKTGMGVGGGLIDAILVVLSSQRDTFVADSHSRRVVLGKLVRH